MSNKVLLTKKLVISIIFTLAVGSLLGNAKAGSTAEVEKVKIGIVGFLSGPALPWGLAQQQSGRIFVNAINEEGGLLVRGKRYRFEIVAYDDKASPSGAVSAVTKMIFDNGCKHIFGPLTASACVAVQSLTKSNNILNFISGFTKIPRGPEYPLTFSWCESPYERYPAICSWMKKNHPNVRNIVIIGTNDEAGHTAVDGAKLAMPKVGYDYKVELYERGTIDFYPMLTRVLAQKPDYIDLDGSPPGDSALMVKQVRELGYKGLIGTIASGIDEVAFCKIAGKENAEGYISIGLCGEKFASPEYIKWMDNYVKTFGTWNAWAAESYVGFQCFKHAILRANSLDPVKIAEKLTGGKDFNTIYGKVYFGGKGIYGRDSQMLYDVQISQMIDGQNQTVALIPPEIK
jgi:branched-chain amino acid transport system substrate-binding protein